jgi:hypothetical protein
MSDEGGVTLSQETDHVSPTEVAPELGKGAQDTWRSPWPFRRAGLIKPAPTQMMAQGGEAVGKPGVAGVYANQRLSLSPPWEGRRMTCQGFKPDPGNLAVRDYRGASENVRHGGNVNPPCNRKSGSGNPSPTVRRVRFLSQLSSRQGWKSGRVKVPVPSIACIRTVSISGVCGGNEAQ